MAIRKRFRMHLRTSHGSTLGYDLLDDADAVIGALSRFTSRSRKHKSGDVYTLFGTVNQEFVTAGEFLAAYEKKKIEAQRDAEWDAADPSKRSVES
jgi:hypothetical protein